MIPFKVRQSQVANKEGQKLFYPVTVSNGLFITTRQIAHELSLASGAMPGDIMGILRNLGLLMRERLKDGHRVILDGIGAFRLRASASGNGVDKAQAVTASQFNRVRVIFTPESYMSRALGRRETTLVSEELRFVPWIKGQAKPSGGTNTSPSDGSDTDTGTPSTGI